jgi:hypothetical protein
MCGSAATSDPNMDSMCPVMVVGKVSAEGLKTMGLLLAVHEGLDDQTIVITGVNINVKLNYHDTWGFGHVLFCTLLMRCVSTVMFGMSSNNIVSTQMHADLFAKRRGRHDIAYCSTTCADVIQHESVVSVTVLTALNAVLILIVCSTVRDLYAWCGHILIPQASSCIYWIENLLIIDRLQSTRFTNPGTLL